MEFAELFEIKTERGVGSYQKRVDARRKGLVGRFMYALVDGFTARFGGKLSLWNGNNTRSAEIGMDDESLLVDVCGVPAMELTSEVLYTNVVEASGIVLDLDEGKYQLQVGTDGMLRAIKLLE